MQAQNENLVRRYLKAVADKDMATVQSLLDPRVAFVGPAMNIDGAANVVESLRRIGAIHVRTDLHRIFSDEDEVCVIYDLVTDPVGAVPTIEWLRIAGDRIASIRLFYDQVPWLTLRKTLAERVGQAAS